MVPVPYDLVIVNFGRLQVIRYGQFHRCRIETLAGLIICLMIEGLTHQHHFSETPVFVGCGVRAVRSKWVS